MSVRRRRTSSDTLAFPGCRQAAQSIESLPGDGLCGRRSSARTRASSHSCFRQRPRRDNLPMRAVASAELLPQSCARIVGILYLLIIATGLFGAFARDRLVVPGDAAVSAVNIKGHAFLLRVANSAATILFPRLASMLFPPVLIPAFICARSSAAWLMVKGVNVANWQEMAERSSS